jgi:hypothetical protein
VRERGRPTLSVSVDSGPFPGGELAVQPHHKKENRRESSGKIHTAHPLPVPGEPRKGIDKMKAPAEIANPA